MKKTEKEQITGGKKTRRKTRGIQKRVRKESKKRA